MEETFKLIATEIGLLHNNKHRTYVCRWLVISPLIKRWSKNRECDQKRVQELLEYHKKGGYIPKLIHIANLKEGLICYDGNHRREMFDLLEDKNFNVIVDVIFDAKEKDVYTSFENINKSVQLPSIYLGSNIATDIQDQIKELVRKYELRYPKLLSPSSRCAKPNFNRDSFTENIFDVYKYFEEEISIEDISTLFQKLNVSYSKGMYCKDHSLIKSTILDKCRKYGLWLFIEGRTISFEHLIKVQQEI